MYGKVVKEIPKDAPDPLGNEVVTTTFLEIRCMMSLQEDLLLQHCTSSTQHLEIGIPKDRQLWRMQPMVLNLLCLGQQQRKFWKSEKPSGTLESLLSQNHTFLLRTSLLSQVLPVPILFFEQRHNILSYH